MQFEDALNALSSLVVRPNQGGTLGISHASLVEEYFDKPELSSRFAIDMSEVHGAISDALRELAPADSENTPPELHRYAIEFEPDHLWHSKRYAEIVSSLAARRLGRAVDERERWLRWTNKLSLKLAPDDEAMVTARETLAAWTGDAGAPGAARDLLLMQLPIRSGLRGDDDEKTILTRGRIAYYTAKLGELGEAAKQYRELKVLCQNKFGWNHKTTLETWRDYARFTGEAGHPVEACDELTELYRRCSEQFGADDENTIAVSENLARFTGEAGNPAAAKCRYQEVLPRRTDRSGMSTDTLITMSNLAYFTGEAGDPYDARRRYCAVLPLWAEAGDKHPDVLTTRTNLARFTAEAGDLEQALTDLNEVLELRQEISPDGHPDTLTTHEIIARITAQSGDPATAARILQHQLRYREVISGERHPDTLATRTNLACFIGMDAEPPGTYYDVQEVADELDEVSAMMTERQIRRPQQRGSSSQPADLPIGRKGASTSEHPDTLTIRAPLAQMNALSRTEVIRTPIQNSLLEHTCRELQALVKDRETASGDEHPDTLTTMENLAYFIGITGNVTLALVELSRLAKMRTEICGETHPTTMTTLGNLAYFKLVAGDDQRARGALENLLGMRESVSSEHPETHYVRRRLASISGEANGGSGAADRDVIRM